MVHCGDDGECENLNIWQGQDVLIRDLFIIDKEGDQIGAFTYEEKKFVTPFHNRMGMAPDIIEDEPSGAAPVDSTTPGDGMRGF